jgi:hypothetical protein
MFIEWFEKTWWTISSRLRSLFSIVWLLCSSTSPSPQRSSVFAVVMGSKVSLKAREQVDDTLPFCIVTMDCLIRQQIKNVAPARGFVAGIETVSPGTVGSYGWSVTEASIWSLASQISPFMDSKSILASVLWVSWKMKIWWALWGIQTGIMKNLDAARGTDAVKLNRHEFESIVTWIRWFTVQWQEKPVCASTTPLISGYTPFYGYNRIIPV